MSKAVGRLSQPTCAVQCLWWLYNDRNAQPYKLGLYPRLSALSSRRMHHVRHDMCNCWDTSGHQSTFAAGFFAVAGFCRHMEGMKVSQASQAPYLSQVTSRRCMRIRLTCKCPAHPIEQLFKVQSSISWQAKSVCCHSSMSTSVPEVQVTSCQVPGKCIFTLAFATFLGLAGPFLNSSLSL